MLLKVRSRMLQRNSHIVARLTGFGLVYRMRARFRGPGPETINWSKC